jgi:hypothetical protein
MPTHRIAPRDSPKRQHPAANDPIFIDRVARIHRATGLEAAGRPVRMDRRRYRRPIKRNRAAGHQARRNLQTSCNIRRRHHALPAIRPPRLRAAIASSSPIAADSSAAAPPRAITTTEVPAGSRSRIVRRKISRTRRFTRLRTTALPILRDTVTPRRERVGSSSRLPAYSTKWGLWKRTPLRWRRKNSALRCSRSAAAKLNGGRT